MSYETDKFVIFSLGKEEFGLSIQHIYSIEKMQDVTAVPQMPSYVKGVINLRGNVIPVIDFKSHVLKKDTIETDNTRIIIAKLHERPTGLIVDQATEVINIPNESIQEVNAMGGSDRIVTVAKLDKRVIIILNINQYFTDFEPGMFIEGMKEVI